MLAAALVDFGTVEATPVIRATGMRMDDLATVEGRLYSNKAPGTALVGLPGYVIARLFTGPASPSSARPTMNAMRIAACAIPVVLLGFWLHRVARALGCSEVRSRIAVAAMLFGTPLLAYGITFFGHALSAFALFGAWALLFVSERTPRNEILAGAIVGLAVLAEYPNAIPAAVILLCAIPSLRVTGSLRVGLGGLPFAVLLGIYNRLAFGSFLTLSSAHEEAPNIRELASSGMFGIGVPKFEYLSGLLADPSKGLFVLSPILLLAFGGIRAARRALSTGAFAALILAPLSILLVIGGYPNWFGGWTVGARYLVGGLPFLALLLAFGRETFLEPLLLGASVAGTAIVSLVFPFVPPDYPAPWITFAWPMLEDGYVVPNLFHFVWRPLAITVPFLLVLAGSLAAVPRARDVAAFAAGAAIWIAAGFAAAASPTLQPPYIRAMVEEVSFGHEGTIVGELPPGPQRRTLELIAPDMKRRPPAGWPF